MKQNVYEYQKNIIINYDSWRLIYDCIKIINVPFNNADYTYPTVKIKVNCNGGYVSIVNTTDNKNRNFIFSNLQQYECLLIDNNQQIVTSSTGLNRFTNFDGKNWMRLMPGDNDLIINGNVREVGFYS